MLISFERLDKEFGVKLVDVLHVGAHEGEELDSYRKYGAGKVFWVEANPSLASNLESKTMKLSSNPINSVISCAVTDVDRDTIKFNVANNGQSSSVLEFGTHSKEHPEVVYVSQVEVETRTIDSLANEYNFTNVNFMNLDIQGAELLALNGAKDFLPQLDWIYSEVNSSELYRSGALVEDIDKFLKDYGFSRQATVMTPHGWGDALYGKAS